MTDKEIIPLSSARKLDILFMHNEVLARNKKLQQEIIDWAEDMLEEARIEWSDIHNSAIDAIITCERKNEALKRGLARDKKYAPFRAYFKDLQQKHFSEYTKKGKKMTANSFVAWFIENIPSEIIIPYKESNQYHKLIKLAEENNREFRKNHP